MSMMIFHAVGFGVQVIMWPLTYWEEWGITYTNIWLAYRKAWQYTGFLSCTGAIWVALALAISGWQDTETLNELTTLTGVTLVFYATLMTTHFWFVWKKMPFIALWYEWNMYETEEIRLEYIDIIWKREFEFDEDDTETF